MNLDNRQSIVIFTFFIVLVAGWAAGMGCTSREEAVVEKPRATAEFAKPDPMQNQARAKELAKLTAQVYREATELSFEAHVTYGAPTEKIHCVIEHGLENRCHLRVYSEEEQLFYELRTEPDPKGVKIQEDNYRGDEKRDYVLSLTEFAPYKWDPCCLAGINGCAFGGYLHSWVGDKSHRAAFWEKTISVGECVGVEDVNGHPCDIVETHRVKGLTERIYLDQKTHIVRRWRYDYMGVIKDRVYSKIEIIYDKGGSGIPVESAKPEPMDNQERAKELAKLTAQAYREATHYSYKVWIEQGKPVERLWCVVEQGRQHRCYLRVYTEEEGLFYELRCVPDPVGVKIREDNYRGGESEEYVVTPADYKVDQWNPRCRKGIYGCAFGTHLRSWLGPESYKPDFFEEIISGGEYVGTEEVNGHLCDVVGTHRVKNLVEKIYLDQKNHTVRRWYNNYNGIVRDRVFSKIEISYDVEKSAH